MPGTRTLDLPYHLLTGTRFLDHLGACLEGDNLDRPSRPGFFPSLPNANAHFHHQVQCGYDIASMKPRVTLIHHVSLLVSLVDVSSHGRLDLVTFRLTENVDLKQEIRYSVQTFLSTRLLSKN